VCIVLNERDEPSVGQVFATGKCQALDTAADSQGHHAAIVDILSEGGEVQSLDEVAIRKERLLDAEGLADDVVFGPSRAGRPVP